MDFIVAVSLVAKELRQFRSGEQKRAHSIDITRGWLEFAGLATDRLNGSQSSIFVNVLEHAGP